MKHRHLPQDEVRKGWIQKDFPRIDIESWAGFLWVGVELNFLMSFLFSFFFSPLVWPFEDVCVFVEFELATPSPAFEIL